MNIDDIFTWILKHPNNYPGKHQESQPRTVTAYKPLEAKAQFHIVLRATAEYIQEKMLDGKGISMKEFGAFTFEVISDAVKPAQLSNFDVAKDLNQQRDERKHVHKIRPCFVPDPQLQYFLARYPGKEEITKPKSQHSIYQKGFGMIFCNPGPIANSCFLGKDVVQSIHYAFIKGVHDLTRLSHNITIDFNFLKIQIQNRDLRYQYKQNFINQLNNTNYEFKMRKSDLPTSQHWSTSYQDKWSQSSLNQLLTRPDPQRVQENYEKTMALKIMSLDLNTADQTSCNKAQFRLPSIQQKK